MVMGLFLEESSATSILDSSLNLEEKTKFDQVDKEKAFANHSSDNTLASDRKMDVSVEFISYENPETLNEEGVKIQRRLLLLSKQLRY